MGPAAVPSPSAIGHAPTSAPLPCPRCAAPLEGAAAACGACGLPLTGPVAASLWSVDQRLAALRVERAALGEERAALITELASGVTGVAPRDARTEIAATDRPYPPETDSVVASQGAQRVLLVAGVVLVTASALGLGALAVTRLGALGQLAVLALLVAASLGASRWSLRRGLSASGESFAVLAVALATTGAGAARSQGVIGPDAVPDRAWPLVVVAGLCVLSAVAAATLRRDGRPMAYGWAALSTGALVPTALVVLLDGGALQAGVVLLAAAAVLPLAAPALTGHGALAREAVLVVAAVHLVVGAVVLAGALVAGPGVGAATGAAVALALLALVCAGWVRLARRTSTPASTLTGSAGRPARSGGLAARAGATTPVAAEVAPVAAPTAWGVAGAAVVTAASAGGADALVLTASALAVAGAVVALARAPRVAATTAVATGAACLLLEVAQRAVVYPAPPALSAPAWAAWSLLALAAAVCALVRPASTAPTLDDPRPAGWPAGAVWAAVSGACAVAAALTVGADALVLTAIALAVAATVAVLVRAPRIVATTAMAAGITCLLLEVAQRAVADPVLPALSAPAWVAWSLLALAAALCALVRPAPAAPPPHDTRLAVLPAAAVWAAVSGIFAVAAALTVPAGAPAGALGGDDPRVPALALVATAALAVAVLVRSRASSAREPGAVRTATEGVLVAVWAGALCLAALMALDTVGVGAPTTSAALPVPLRAVLALAGAQALLHGLLPGRTPFRVVGVAVLAGAWWSTVGDLAVLGGPDAPVEVWSLPPAALALVVGVVTRRPRPTLPTWATLGPGLLLGLVPSTLRAVTVDAPGDVMLAGTDAVLGAGPRPALVLVVAVALVVLGARASWQAPLVLGAAAAIVVGLVQLGPYVVQLPLWTTTGAAGVVVLVLAVRLEAARRSSARALTWLAALR